MKQRSENKSNPLSIRDYKGLGKTIYNDYTSWVRMRRKKKNK